MGAFLPNTIELYNKTEDLTLHNSLVTYFYNLKTSSSNYIEINGFQEYNISKIKAQYLLKNLNLDYIEESENQNIS